jgi:hypothetical protein
VVERHDPEEKMAKSNFLNIVIQAMEAARKQKESGPIYRLGDLMNLHENLKPIKDVYAQACELSERLNDALSPENWNTYIAKNPPSGEVIAILIYKFLESETEERRLEDSKSRSLRAHTQHAKSGGAKERRKNIISAWVSGKYNSRDECAEKEARAYGISFSTARNYLRNTPDPKRSG